MVSKVGIDELNCKLKGSIFPAIYLPQKMFSQWMWGKHFCMILFSLAGMTDMPAILNPLQVAYITSWWKHGVFCSSLKDQGKCELKLQKCFRRDKLAIQHYLNLKYIHHELSGLYLWEIEGWLNLISLLLWAWICLFPINLRTLMLLCSPTLYDSSCIAGRHTCKRERKVRLDYIPKCCE